MKDLRLFLLIGAWYFFSAFTNNVGKQLLTEFDYPVTLAVIINNDDESVDTISDGWISINYNRTGRL